MSKKHILDDVVLTYELAAKQRLTLRQRFALIFK